MIYSSFPDYDLEAMNQNDNYFMNFFPVMYQFMIPFEEELPFSGHVPVTNDQGQLLIHTNDYLSFVLNGNASSETQELAWDFMKFVQDPANAEKNPNIFPIMVPVYRPMMQFHLERQVASQFGYYQEIYNRQSTLSIEDAVDNVFGILDQISKMPMSCQYVYYSTVEVAEIIHDIITQFHEGMLTAEQTAAELQNQISLAFEE